MINRKCAVSLLIFGIALLLCFITMHIMQLFNITRMISFLTALGIYVITFIAILVFYKHKAVYMLTIPVNAIANGIAAGTLFDYIGFPAIWQTAVVFFLLCLLFYIYCVLTRLSLFRKHFIICIIIYSAVLVAVNAVCLALIGGPVFILSILSLITFISFLILLVLKAQNSDDIIKSSAYLTFSVLALIIIIGLAVVTEGYAFQALESAVDGNSEEKKNPYNYFSKK